MAMKPERTGGPDVAPEAQGPDKPAPASERRPVEKLGAILAKVSWTDADIEARFEFSLRAAHAHGLLHLLEVRLHRVEDLPELAQHGDSGLVVVDRRIAGDGDEFGASGHASIISVDSTVPRHSFRVWRGPECTKKKDAGEGVRS